MPRRQPSAPTDSEIKIAKALETSKRTLAKIELDLARTYQALAETQEQLARLQINPQDDTTSTLTKNISTTTYHNFKLGDKVQILTNTKINKFKGHIGTIVHITQHTVSIQVTNTRHHIIVKHKNTVAPVL